MSTESSFTDLIARVRRGDTDGATELSKARRGQFSAGRDVRRGAASSAEEQNLAAAASSRSQQVVAKEMLVEVQRRLSDQERKLLELRHEGRDWDAIAAELGGSPEALRKQLARVANELGFDEADDE
jgi:DNA-binding NarL/FixJ family response regulator